MRAKGKQVNEELDSSLFTDIIDYCFIGSTNKYQEVDLWFFKSSVPILIYLIYISSIVCHICQLRRYSIMSTKPGLILSNLHSMFNRILIPLLIMAICLYFLGAFILSMKANKLGLTVKTFYFLKLLSLHISYLNLWIWQLKIMRQIWWWIISRVMLVLMDLLWQIGLKEDVVKLQVEHGQKTLEVILMLKEETMLWKRF